MSYSGIALAQNGGGSNSEACKLNCNMALDAKKNAAKVQRDACLQSATTPEQKSACKAVAKIAIKSAEDEAKQCKKNCVVAFKACTSACNAAFEVQKKTINDEKKNCLNNAQTLEQRTICKTVADDRLEAAKNQKNVCLAGC